MPDGRPSIHSGAQPAWLVITRPSWAAMIQRERDSDYNDKRNAERAARRASKGGA